MARKNKFPKRKSIIICIIAVFVLAVIIRVVMVLTINSRFTDGMAYNTDADYRGEYEYYEDGYYYYYSPASFFSTECFARICSLESMRIYINSSGEQYTKGMSITLFIWPKLNKSCEVGVHMEQIDAEHSINEAFYIDLDLNYVYNTGDEGAANIQRQLLEQYHEEINLLLEKARVRWEL